MNVWLWGPSMWTIVHGLAYKADEDPFFQMPFETLVRQLRTVLPCRQCKDSYNVFLDNLGMPPPGANLEWTYRLHNKVNEKLEKQRLEKTLSMDCFRTANNGSLLQSLQSSECREMLFSRPSFEVLRKRAIVLSSNPWSERDILFMALVLYLHAQGPRDNTVEAYFGPDEGQSLNVSPEVLQTQNAFVKNLAEVHKQLGSPKAFVNLLDTLLKQKSLNAKVAKLARELYPQDSPQKRLERIRLFRAGACLNGTCV